MALLATVEGRLLAIDGIREACIDENSVRFSKAMFLVSFGIHLKMGTMMFWGEEVNVLLNLRLGQNYRFLAGLEMEDDLFLLYFLPECTRFEESVR